jgi:hypothetical protein
MDKEFDIRDLKEKCTHSFYNELESKGPFGKHRFGDNFKATGKLEWCRDWANLVNDRY